MLIFYEATTAAEIPLNSEKLGILYGNHVYIVMLSIWRGWFDNKDLFAIEEYKLAKEKIRKNEERRYALLALNITAFAAIFGLSDKLDLLDIPIAVTTILLICSVSYTMQSLI